MDTQPMTNTPETLEQTLNRLAGPRSPFKDPPKRQPAPPLTHLEQLTVDNSPSRIWPVTHRTPFLRGAPAKWCGPAAISIITGRTMECAAAWINFQRGNPPHFQVGGSTTWEVRYVLEQLGYRLVNHWDITKQKGYDGSSTFRRLHSPTMAGWIRSRTHAERKMTFLVVASRHWMVVRGNLYGCGLRPELVNTSESKYRRSRVTEVYSLRYGLTDHTAAIRNRRVDPMPPWARFECHEQYARPWLREHEVELAQHRIGG